MVLPLGAAARRAAVATTAVAALLVTHVTAVAAPADDGPVPAGITVEKVDGLVRDAVGRGATARLGGEPVERAGYFYPATVLTDVPADAEMGRTEIFGPVAAVTPFDTEDEAVALANDTPYGLVSYVFTRDLDRALRVSEALEAGMVGLN